MNLTLVDERPSLNTITTSILLLCNCNNTTGNDLACLPFLHSKRQLYRRYTRLNNGFYQSVLDDYRNRNYIVIYQNLVFCCQIWCIRNVLHSIECMHWCCMCVYVPWKQIAIKLLVDFDACDMHTNAQMWDNSICIYLHSHYLSCDLSIHSYQSKCHNLRGKTNAMLLLVNIYIREGLMLYFIHSKHNFLQLAHF